MIFRLNAVLKNEFFSWQLGGHNFVLLIILINTLPFNFPLYSYIASNLELFSLSGIAIALTITAVVIVFNLFFISVFGIIHPILLKTFFVITALINSVALYFMIKFQVILDVPMMGNIFNTQTSEASELFTPVLMVYFLLLGVLPAWLIARVKVLSANRIRILINMIIGIFLGIVFIYSNSASWLWIDKYSSIIGGKILPWAYVGNAIAHYSEGVESSDNQELLPDGSFDDEDKMVVVLVIGETARAKNFAFYGYERDTNPLLREVKALALPNTKACSTYTTASIACMLSHDTDDTDTYETLPTYLNRHGAEVIWRSGNWGEPAITVEEYHDGSILRPQCTGSGCQLDGVLLTNLTERIQATQANKVFVILHTKGSHGPSYYSRYPAEFEKYTPVCRDENIADKCSQEELINAYDNTLVYTDFFLREAINKLNALDGVPSMLVYISDHGESLGENGLYLHGTPYAFAPDVQKDIPFIIWTSEAFNQKRQVDLQSLELKESYSQANIFHTVIGAFGLKSEIYSKELDVLGK